MGARYKKNERVSRTLVGKQTKAAWNSSRRLQKVGPTKIITMGKKIKITSRTPKKLR